MKNTLEHCLGRTMVVDTDSNWVYLGTLEAVTDQCLTLIEADAHDITDTDASKEFYIFDARTSGIKPNRKRVHVNLAAVVSFSLMDEIKTF